ncbi:hypothetical protein PWT90_00503 [Aphanocladium album]|nr:hypothetical protein PWT90_00503 [Aphanocladium album]
MSDTNDSLPPTKATDEVSPAKPNYQASTSYGWRFWAIFLALGLTSLLSAIEGTVTSTALPTISGDLHAGSKYVWFVNAYFLTSLACLPLFGQFADIFGRRWLTIGLVAIFALGSGISGGATNLGMLIAGRAVQGVGGGGILLMVEMLVCDLVPLRDRGTFMGYIFGIFMIGTSLGPFIGGVIVSNTTWRWAFYINLPVAGASLILLTLFLHVGHEGKGTVVQRLRRIDYTGNVILVAATSAILIALSFGGSDYPWGSYHVLVPLILGFAGIGLFVAWEASPWCKEPTIPLHLLGNRTTLAALFLTFVHSLIAFFIMYFMPVYFQGVQGTSATRSGILLFPTVMTIVPGGLIAGVIMTKTGRYKPLHIAGFALVVLGIGLFIMLNRHSGIALYVVFQMISGLGLGLALTTLLPATQASLQESDTATSTALWTYIRTFGTVWGVSVPAAIFNSRASSLSSGVTDEVARSFVANGKGYDHATAAALAQLSPAARSEVVGVFEQNIRLVWIVATAIVGVSFFAVFFEEEIELRSDLDTEYGMRKENEKRK